MKVVELKRASFHEIKHIFVSLKNRYYFSNSFEERYENCDSCEFYKININNLFVGGLILHDYDKYSKRIMFTIAISEEQQNKGNGSKAMKKLLDYIFNDRKIRRIFIEVYETNRRAIELYKKFGFKKEGSLRKHTYKKGNYIDLFIMGLLKEEYMNKENVQGDGK